MSFILSSSCRGQYFWLLLFFRNILFLRNQIKLTLSYNYFHLSTATFYIPKIFCNIFNIPRIISPLFVNYFRLYWRRPNNMKMKGWGIAYKDEATGKSLQVFFWCSQNITSPFQKVWKKSGVSIEHNQKSQMFIFHISK